MDSADNWRIVVFPYEKFFNFGESVPFALQFALTFLFCFFRSTYIYNISSYRERLSLTGLNQFGSRIKLTARSAPSTSTKASGASPPRASLMALAVSSYQVPVSSSQIHNLVDNDSNLLICFGFHLIRSFWLLLIPPYFSSPSLCSFFLFSFSRILVKFPCEALDELHCW